MPYNIWMDAHTAICQDPDNNFIKYVNCSGTQQPRILLSMPSAQKHFSGNTEAINFQLAFVFSGLTGVGSVPWHTGIWGEGKKERTWKQQRPGRTGPDHWRPLCFISPPKWNVYIYVHSYIYPRQPASLQTCRSSGMGRGSHQCLTSIYLLIDNTTGCCMFFSYSVHHICLAQPAQIGVTNRNPTMKQLHQHPATDWN